MESILTVIKDVPFSTWLLLGTTVVVLYATCRGIYLLYFHPLAKFPGPKIAAVSNIWYAYHWFSGRYPWAIEAVLNRYGDVVRIAPNELVFMTPQAQNGKSVFLVR
ncbi:hypothetical protein ABVK25_010775 [Lepraria finkii]|uniref:Cytochrome P450 n=1 Tax=Lepraria finkii TaxID=1340010 RepID=A0ABR4AT88_9LECA